MRTRPGWSSAPLPPSRPVSLTSPPTTASSGRAASPGGSAPTCLADRRPAGTAHAGAAPARHGGGGPAQRLAPGPGRPARRDLGLRTTISFGERAAAERAAARVRRIHEHVTGTDPVTGRPYAAGDPALLLWVHAALVDSAIAARQAFGTPLAARGRRRLRRGDGGCRRACRGAGGPGPGQRRRAGELHGGGPAGTALHPGRRGVDGLPAGPARAGRGHRGDLAGHPRWRGRDAAGLGAGDVRLPRAAAADA